MSEMLSPELVKEFVYNAHGDFNKVRELLYQEPNLINASLDWGGGDWETGLGAAAQVGRSDIAEYLLNHGARMDLFAAAMLGKLAIVRAFLENQPELLYAAGPHTIPLMDHAKAGGNNAASTLDYLESLAAG